LPLSCGARLRPGYPQHYCTLRMPVARPRWRYRRSCRPGKSRVTSGYTASRSSRASARSPTSSSCRRRPRTGRPDLGAADRGARGQMGPGRAREHQRRTRQRRTRPDRRTEQELAWHIAVIPPAGPGVRRSDSRGSAIRKILRPSPTLPDGREPCWVHAISSRSPASITAGHRPCRHLRFGRNPGKLQYFHAVPLALAGSGPSVARTQVASSSPS
jgi:hypothetical protein